MSEKKYLLAGKVTVFIEKDVTDVNGKPNKEMLVDLIEGDLHSLGYKTNKLRVWSFTVNEIEEG